MGNPFHLQDLGENITTGDVVKILVQVGDTIAAQQIVLELETDKAIVEVPSPYAGTIEAIHIQAGDHIQVGDLLFTFADKEVVAESKPVKPKSAVVSQADQTEINTTPQNLPVQPAAMQTNAVVATVNAVAYRKPLPAAPSVRRLARELGVDIYAVRGTGPGERIGPEDVKAYARQRLSKPSVGQVQGAVATDFAKWGSVRRERMTSVRRKTAEQLGTAWSTIPHVTHDDQADATEIERQRVILAKGLEPQGVKLTMTTILVKIVAQALRHFPKFAASIDMQAEEIIYKDYIHIGVAVDTPRGLLVPVVRDADKKSLLQIAKDLQQLSEQARIGKIAIDDLRGACFTISNLGGIGGMRFSPLINPPEVAILGVARTTVQPVYLEERFQPRKMIPFSLSYDHRLIDGADAARFCRWLAGAIESPLQLLIDDPS